MNCSSEQVLTMSDTNLSERVHDLEERVSYLEGELDLSVEQGLINR
jgi:hypothetical protein